LDENSEHIDGRQNEYNADQVSGDFGVNDPEADGDQQSPEPTLRPEKLIHYTPDPDNNRHCQNHWQHRNQTGHKRANWSVKEFLHDAQSEKFG
jgi:hypothetical protein